MKKIKSKISLEKVKIARINNMKQIFGGNGGSTQPTNNTTVITGHRPTTNGTTP